MKKKHSASTVRNKRASARRKPHAIKTGTKYKPVTRAATKAIRTRKTSRRLSGAKRKGATSKSQHASNRKTAKHTRKLQRRSDERAKKPKRTAGRNKAKTQGRTRNGKRSAGGKELDRLKEINRNLLRQNDELRRNTPRLGHKRESAYDDDEGDDSGPDLVRHTDRDNSVGADGGREETLDYYEGDTFEETDWGDSWDDAYDDVDDEDEDDYEATT